MKIIFVNNKKLEILKNCPIIKKGLFYRCYLKKILN